VEKGEQLYGIAAASRSSATLAVVLRGVPGNCVLVSLSWSAGSDANLHGANDHAYLNATSG